MNHHADIDASRLRIPANTEGSLSQRVYISLKQAILSLDFAPGALIRKADVCDRLEVSRAPVSEALARLAADGLVDIVAQSGTRVAYLSMDDIREASFLREALELATVDRITGQLSPDQKVRLSRNMRLQEVLAQDEDAAGFFAADEEFHTMLFEFTGFPNLSEVAEKISLQVTRARMTILPKPGRIDETIGEHRRIVDALIEGDTDITRAAMRDHLRQMMPRIKTLHETAPELFKPQP